MSKILRFLFAAVLLSIVSTAGCGSVNTPPSVYQVVTIADLHFNPFYDPSLYSALAAADPSQWNAIFQGSAITAPAAAGTDTNYPLLALTLASVKQNMGMSPVVLSTGDLLGHNIPQLFYTAYYGTRQYGTPDATATAAMQQFVDKTFAFVALQIRAALGDAPVIYAPGNIDTYGIGLGPDSTFLTDNAETIYTQFLNSASNQSTFLNTFTLDGYYSVQPFGAKLLVIVLNTNSFFTGSPSASDASGELAWLNSQLAAAQAAGQQVWILMHVPPGANAQGIAQQAATPNDVDENTVSMMWDQTLQSAFMQTLAQYHGLVTMLLAGHTHMDEFRLLPTGDVLEQLPGISPSFGNNPAYKILTIAQDTSAPLDFQSFDYNLATKPPAFSSLYRFSDTYGAKMTLRNSLEALYLQLILNESTRKTFTLLYGSGATSVNAATQAPWNPITNINWPIFACTIREMDEPNFIECVNGY